MSVASMFKAMHGSMQSSKVLGVGSRKYQFSCYCTDSRYFSTLPVDRMGGRLNAIRQIVNINHMGITSGSALMRINWSRSVAKFSSLKSNKLGEMKKNGEIKFPTLRVVFKNEETGANEWKIMTRKEALALANSKSLDLLLVNATSDPPVCKLESFVQVLGHAKKKAKESLAMQRSRVIKEMFFTAGIESRDFAFKMEKVKQFISEGHSVKVVIVHKTFRGKHRFKDGIRRNRMEGFDETVLMLLKSIEKLPVLMQETVVKKKKDKSTKNTFQKSSSSEDPEEEEDDDDDEDGESDSSDDDKDGEDDSDGEGNFKKSPKQSYASKFEPLVEKEEEKSSLSTVASPSQVGSSSAPPALNRREFLLTPKNRST